MRERDYARAEQEMAILRREVPPNPMVDTLAARLMVASGDMPQALQFYRDALKNFPRHRALIYDYGDALLRAHQDSEALKLINDRLQVFPDDHHLYLLQARTYAALGNRFLQHTSQAEAYVRLWDIPAAIEQLQIALRGGDGDFYERSSAEARLKELQATAAAQKKPKL